jgi:hypothetical protein
MFTRFIVFVLATFFAIMSFSGCSVGVLAAPVAGPSSLMGKHYDLVKRAAASLETSTPLVRRTEAAERRDSFHAHVNLSRVTRFQQIARRKAQMNEVNGIQL